MISAGGTANRKMRTGLPLSHCRYFLYFFLFLCYRTHSWLPIFRATAMRPPAFISLLILFAMAGCAGTGPPRGSLPPDTQVGFASYYASRFNGLRTASGERYDETSLTAAHRTLPFGTRVQVTNLGNGRHVVVTINDRGPFARGRVIDVSRRAARKLDFVRDGTARVRLEILEN